MTVGIGAERLVVATAGGDEVEPGAAVGVRGQAAVARRRADRDDGGGARRVRHLARVVVARGPDDDDVVAGGKADRVDQGGDVAGGHVGIELEAEVDHLSVVADRVAHAMGDRCRVAVAVAVEDPNRHDRGAVRQPRQTDPVVGALGEDPGHERAVTFTVEREAVARDEVVGIDEPRAVEIGRAAKAVPVSVGDAGVEDRHGDAAASSTMVGAQVGPRPGRVHPGSRQEVPLESLPPAAMVRAAGIVGYPTQPVGVGDEVRHRVRDSRPVAQTSDRGRHAHAGREVQHERLRGGYAGGGRRRSRLIGHVGDHRWERPGRGADNDLTGDVIRGPRCARTRRRGGQRTRAGERHGTESTEVERVGHRTRDRGSRSRIATQFH